MVKENHVVLLDVKGLTYDIIIEFYKKISRIFNVFTWCPLSARTLTSGPKKLKWLFVPTGAMNRILLALNSRHREHKIQKISPKHFITRNKCAKVPFSQKLITKKIDTTLPFDSHCTTCACLQIVADEYNHLQQDILWLMHGQISCLPKIKLLLPHRYLRLDRLLECC